MSENRSTGKAVGKGEAVAPPQSIKAGKGLGKGAPPPPPAGKAGKGLGKGSHVAEIGAGQRSGPKLRFLHVKAAEQTVAAETGSIWGDYVPVAIDEFEPVIVHMYKVDGDEARQVVATKKLSMENEPQKRIRVLEQSTSLKLEILFHVLPPPEELAKILIASEDFTKAIPERAVLALNTAVTEHHEDIQQVVKLNLTGCEQQSSQAYTLHWVGDSIDIMTLAGDKVSSVIDLDRGTPFRELRQNLSSALRTPLYNIRLYRSDCLMEDSEPIGDMESVIVSVNLNQTIFCPEKLDVPERYLWVIGSVPFASVKVASGAFLVGPAQELGCLKDRAAMVNAACTALRESDLLKRCIFACRSFAAFVKRKDNPLVLPESLLMITNYRSNNNAHNAAEAGTLSSPLAVVAKIVLKDTNQSSQNVSQEMLKLLGKVAAARSVAIDEDELRCHEICAQGQRVEEKLRQALRQAPQIEGAAHHQIEGVGYLLERVCEVDTQVDKTLTLVREAKGEFTRTMTWSNADVGSKSGFFQGWCAALEHLAQAFASLPQGESGAQPVDQPSIKPMEMLESSHLAGNALRAALAPGVVEVATPEPAMVLSLPSSPSLPPPPRRLPRSVKLFEEPAASRVPSSMPHDAKPDPFAALEPIGLPPSRRPLSQTNVTNLPRTLQELDSNIQIEQRSLEKEPLRKETS